LRLSGPYGSYDTSCGACQRWFGFQHCNCDCQKGGIRRLCFELDYGSVIDANWKPPARGIVLGVNTACSPDRSQGGGRADSGHPGAEEQDPVRISDEIPVTYVPARNTIFLSLALGWCEVLQAQDIFIGVNAVDYSGYPDCRPEFLDAFERLANVATKAGVKGASRYRIHAPLLHMSKAQIIQAGFAAGVDFSLTHSCYDPDPEGLACGACDSCILRRRGFEDAGLPDPTRYAK
jgi:hypothetical protein